MKLPRDLSASELITALARYGYSVSRQRGSHLRLTTQEGGEHHLTIPNHDPLRVGTLRSILSDVADHRDTDRATVVKELFGG
jgi:predicted RNA binding protein YcfA (HicA-like mRNA interferase family)